MSREIEFRVWDYTQGRYLKHIKNITNDMAGQFHHVDGEEINGSDTTLLYDDVEVEQYTGHKDKNGKKIYEGDVVKCWDDENGEVYFCDISLQYRVKFTNGDDEDLASCEAEIIGTIHENPELVGDKDVTNTKLGEEDYAES